MIALSQIKAFSTKVMAITKCGSQIASSVWNHVLVPPTIKVIFISNATRGDILQNKKADLVTTYHDVKVSSLRGYNGSWIL